MDYSRLTLYKNIQFPRDYSHVLHFSNVTEQRNYFSQSSLIHSTYTDFLYIEKSRKIVVDKVAGDLLGVNYLSFINGDNSKVYYAFVDDLIYESDGSTTLIYTIDIMQTYMFDYELGTCDVEREHAIRFLTTGQRTNDGIFTPELQITSNETISEHISTLRHNARMGTPELYWIVFYRKEYILGSDEQSLSATMLPTYGVPISSGSHTFYWGAGNDIRFATYEELMRINDSNIFGAQLITELPIDYSVNTAGIASAKIITDVQAVSIGNDILNQPIYVLDLTSVNPATYVTEKSLGSIDDDDFGFNNPVTNKNTRFTDAVKANYYKMWTSQYTQIAVSTTGNIEYLKGELMPPTSSITISLGTTMANPVVQYLRIKGYIYDSTSSKVFGKFIKNDYSIPVRSNSYYEWFVSNGLTGAFDVIGSAITGGLIGGAVGAVIGGVGGAIKYGAQNIQAVIKPDSLINIKTSIPAFRFKEGLNTYVERISIKDKDTVFNMFQRFGYATNMTKTPNFNSHYWFNYIKNTHTSLKNIKNMTHNIIEKIKSVYNSGVTLWHYNGGNYKWIDYNCNNIERSIAT